MRARRVLRRYLIGPVVERGRVRRGYGTEHIGLDAAPRERRLRAHQVQRGAARLLLQMRPRAPGPKQTLTPEIHVDRVRLKTHTQTAAVTRALARHLSRQEA